MIQTPVNGFWGLSLWDDFGSGWDILPLMANPGTGIKRFEIAGLGGFTRTENQRFEITTPGVFRRIDQ